MPAQTKKTDNDFLADKVQLRVDHCPRPIGRPARVLDCYGGKGVVWRLVEAKTSVKVERVAIDSRTDLSDFHLHGDNIKVMAGMDLTGFDVIDLDAYGIPAAQLVEVFESGFTGVVFATAIQTMQGIIPRIILDDLGFPDAVSKKSPLTAEQEGVAIDQRVARPQRCNADPPQIKRPEALPLLPDQWCCWRRSGL